MRALATVLALASTASAQQFQLDTVRTPQGAPGASGFTENVELFDVDGDGDLDVLYADGGEFGVQQNRLLLNQGGAQAGAVGWFTDATATRYPAVLDGSRDIDFVDLDNDGDLDFFVSNTSGVANQTCRFMVNMGGAQGGAQGFFQDQTPTRYRNLGQNNGTTTHSSIAPSLVLGGGGYIDWSCDSAFYDLDNDGDSDLVQATYGSLSLGKSPTRLFLNDGVGGFEEFNPSGFQLAGADIVPLSPGLWCEGLQRQRTTNTSGAECDIANVSVSIEGGDFDGDFDVDLLLGEKNDEARIIRNRTMENGGALAFRDVSHASFGVADWAPMMGSYEQELGDHDNDGDLDIYGTNWLGTCNTVSNNDGAGFFGAPTVVANTCTRHDEPDYVDYDNDGDLDVIVAARAAAEELHRNDGLGAGGSSFAAVSGVLPGAVSNAMGVDAADTDQDGDPDLWFANDFDDPETHFVNVTGTPDVHAPRISALEQVADRSAGPAPTVVRAHVFDNSGWYVTALCDAQLEHRVGGSGAFLASAMRFSGGQVFRGEIPGFLEGLVEYRVRCTDAAGNSATSITRSFLATACVGAPTVYCTAKTNSLGCVPAIGFSGTPSVSAGSGFVIRAEQSLPDKAGLLFYSLAGPKITAYQGGFLCVKTPTVRTALLNSGSSGVGPCTGVFAFDFNAYAASGIDPQLQQPGRAVWAQFWSRDPQSSFQTNRTDALSFFMCP
ncbi:MAG: VCBS repeat-containing protein [Planctomycetes bacterium]|nr:VCBS repeat-containing protein [Planctomycetota bacterium]